MNIGDQVQHKDIKDSQGKVQAIAGHEVTVSWVMPFKMDATVPKANLVILHSAPEEWR